MSAADHLNQKIIAGDVPGVWDITTALLELDERPRLAAASLIASQTSLLALTPRPATRIWRVRSSAGYD